MTEHDDEEALNRISDRIGRGHMRPETPADIEESARRIAAVIAEHPLRYRNVIEAVKACEQEPDGRGGPDRFTCPELRDALVAVAGDKGAISTSALGYWLRSNAGRIVDGLRIVPDGEGQRVQRWRCESV